MAILIALLGSIFQKIQFSMELLPCISVSFRCRRYQRDIVCVCVCVYFFVVVVFKDIELKTHKLL